MANPPPSVPPLRALVVDDELPALEELTYLLGKDPRIGTIHTASSGAEALRALEERTVDVVFCDVRMPALDGLDLARVLARFSHRPQVVFVTAYDRHAIDAFDLRATDYVMKPVRPQRLAEAVRRAQESVAANSNTPVPAEEIEDETIAVELGGVTRFVQRSQVRFVEAHGDYARLHTDAGSHLIRIPLTTLEERWADAGFIRIHRSTLVALPHVDEIRVDGGRCSVRIGDRMLQVSRRHTKKLRDKLVRATNLAKDHR